MSRANWDAQELYVYQGMLVWIVDDDPGYNTVKMAPFPHGEIFKITQEEYQNLESASPEELEDAGI